MNWLREEWQWLFTGVLAGAGCLTACIAVTALLAIFVFGVNVIPAPAPVATLPPATSAISQSATAPPQSPTPALTQSPDPSLPTATPQSPISELQSPTPTVAQSPVSNLPPSGLIVYTCFEDDFDNICTINADGSDPRTLTNVPATDFYPEISPLGDLIVFSSRRSGEFRIYLMDLDGQNVRQVGPDTGSQFAPDISPDGTQIIFTNAFRGASPARRYQNIWIMDIDGGNPRPLTTGLYNDVDPVWSPDGRQIAFSSDRGWRPAHWIMDADGENMRMLPDEVAEHGGRSDWSPDGQWLAFYAGPRDNRDVYRVATDESGQSVRLTYNGRNLAPAYSPDGAWIVFTSYREGDNANLFIMRPDGTDVRQLTSNPRPDWQPRWGP